MPWEISFLEWIDRTMHGSEIWNQIVKYFSVLNDIGLIWIILGIILLCIKKYRRVGVMFLLTLAVGFIFNDLMLKKLVMRPRPYENSEQLANFVLPLFEKHENLHPIINKLIGGALPGGSSFPSGHTYSSFNCAYMLYLVHKKWGIPALIFAVLMALSRLFLCVHYPSDVLAGMVFGLLTAYLMHRLVSPWVKKKEKPCA